jgi:rhodanese-related sulfurtransferase
MEFAVAHVPGSVHIALSGQYASWAARILGLDRRIILVGEDADQLRESQLRLARVGIEHVDAYLDGGITGWIHSGYELDYIPQVSVQELADLQEKKDTSPYSTSASPAKSKPEPSKTPSASPWANPQTAPPDSIPKLLVVHCKGGYRSSIATASCAARASRRSPIHRVADA